MEKCSFLSVNWEVEGLQLLRLFQNAGPNEVVQGQNTRDISQDGPLVPCQAARQQQGLNWKPALTVQQAGKRPPTCRTLRDKAEILSQHIAEEQGKAGALDPHGFNPPTGLGHLTKGNPKPALL